MHGAPTLSLGQDVARLRTLRVHGACTTSTTYEVRSKRNMGGWGAERTGSLKQAKRFGVILLQSQIACAVS
jgi:hypothetical protein